MSEHELWNELGNLYFLAGAHEQAMLAYNKAIQFEGNFGKPYSNLALVYTKQEKFEDAIYLYKKSLELLTDDLQKAITWNRLGNVYRQLEDYQEAVSAYKCADKLRSALAPNNESNQLPCSISESELLAYEIGEEQQDIQYNAVDYLYELEPEFNEILPESVCVEAETAVEKNQHSQSAHIQSPNESFLQSEPDLQVEISEDIRSDVISTNSTTDEEPSDELAIEFSVAPVEKDISDKDTNEPAFKVAESDDLTDANVSDEIEGNLSEDAAPTKSEADLSLEENFPEIDSEYEEPIAQENVESSSVDLALSVPPTENTPVGTGSEMDIEILNSIAPAEDEFDANDQKNSNQNSLDVSVDEAQQARNDEPDKVEKDIHVEEKKLAKQIEINPRSATTWEALGTLYKTAGRYEEAIQAFEQAISIAPREVSYYHNLGLVYAAQGNNQEAFNTFQKVLELEPNHSLTHASLGGYYKKIGLDELAQKHIGKAMKHIYESENEYNRACLDAICGNTDRAIDLLRIALKNEQTYVDWVLNDPDLDPLRGDERFKQLIADFSN